MFTVPLVIFISNSIAVIVNSNSLILIINNGNVFLAMYTDRLPFYHRSAIVIYVDNT